MRYGIIVSGLSDAARVCAGRRPTHVLGLAGHMAPIVPVAFDDYLSLDIADVEKPDLPGAPARADVERILAFGHGLPAGALLLVHCEMGVSRGTAAALALIAQEVGIDRLDEAAAMLRSLRPQAHPNLLIAQHADDLLGLGGRLMARLPAIRQAADDWLAMQIEDASEATLKSR